MQSFNRKDLSVIVVVLLLALAGGTYYWFKIRVPDVLSPEAVKNQCLEKMKNATNDELIQEIGNLEYTEEIDPVSGENRLTAAHKSIINYFICKVRYTKDEDTYDLAKNYFTNMDIREENKKAALDELESVINDNQLIGKKDEILALWPIESICVGINPTDSFIEMHQGSDFVLRGFETKEQMVDKAREFCRIISQYTNTPSSFIEDMVVEKDWSNNEYILEFQMRMQIATAFRLGGEELALEVCNYIPSLENKEGCLDYAGYLGGLDKCELLRQSVEYLVCPDN